MLFLVPHVFPPCFLVTETRMLPSRTSRPSLPHSPSIEHWTLQPLKSLTPRSVFRLRFAIEIGQLISSRKCFPPYIFKIYSFAILVIFFSPPISFPLLPFISFSRCGTDLMLLGSAGISNLTLPRIVIRLTSRIYCTAFPQTSPLMSLGISFSAHKSPPRRLEAPLFFLRTGLLDASHPLQCRSTLDHGWRPFFGPSWVGFYSGTGRHLKGGGRTCIWTVWGGGFLFGQGLNNGTGPLLGGGLDHCVMGQWVTHLALWLKDS